MAKKTPAPAADQTEAVALSLIPEFQPIELDIVRDILPLKGRQYDLTAPEGMQEAKADLKTITSYLTRLESARKVTKEVPFRLCQQIDSEAKRIAQPVEEEIKNPLRLAIQTEEGRLAKIEAARVEAIQKRIQQIQRRPGWGAKAADIRTMLNWVAEVEIDAAFAELQDAATVAKAEALRDLRAMLETATEAERQQAELVAGHARLAEQVASQTVPVASVTVTPEMARLDKPCAAVPAPMPPSDCLREIMRLCESLAFGAEREDLDRINRIHSLAMLVLKALP